MACGVWTSGGVRVAQMAALLGLLYMPRAQAAWVGRVDPQQLMGPWYILAVASREKGFMLEKDTRRVEGVVVTLTPENKLQLLSSRHGPEGCSQSTVELQRKDPGWVFQNPSVGVLEYRVLSTNFRDYAIVFLQLEFGEEDFSTVELYSRAETASKEAARLFTRWSRELGFWSQQQAWLHRDFTCAHGTLQ